MKILLFILCVFILSCKDVSKDKAGISFIEIALDSPIEPENFINKVSGFRFIPLEAREQLIISGIDKCVVKPDHFYILDKKQQSIFVFTHEGKFVSQINKLGRGAAEYIELTDFEIGNQGEFIIFDAVGRKLLFYNSKLEFTKSLNVCAGDKMLLLNNGTIIIYADIPEKQGYGIYVFDKAGFLKQTLLPVLDDKEIRPAYHREKHLDYQDGKIRFVRSFDYHVYEIQDDSLGIRYCFDFGKKNMPGGLLRGSYPEVFQNVLKDKSVQMLDNYIETDAWITFEVNGEGVFYEKKTKQYYIPANGLEAPYALIFQHAPKVVNSGTYYTVISAKNIISSLMPLVSHEQYLQKYPVLEHVKNLSLHEDDNDVLVEYHLSD